MQQVSCIIPMYNEASRIAGVLTILTKIPNIGQIICVDDGSSDNAAQVVQQQFPQVQCITHPINQGKASAIKTGLHISSYDTIFLCDADLKELIQEEIQQAIDIFFQKQADMVILKRENAPIHIKAFRGHILITGLRILKKRDLENIVSKKIQGFSIETSINKYMMEKNKKCLRTPSSVKNTTKTEKYGLIQGLRKDMEMYYEMDLVENKFLEQILAFHIECGIDQPGIIEKIIQQFELTEE